MCMHMRSFDVEGLEIRARGGQRNAIRPALSYSTLIRFRDHNSVPTFWRKKNSAAETFRSPRVSRRPEAVDDLWYRYLLHTRYSAATLFFPLVLKSVNNFENVLLMEREKTSLLPPLSQKEQRRSLSLSLSLFLALSLFLILSILSPSIPLEKKKEGRQRRFHPPSSPLPPPPPFFSSLQWFLAFSTWQTTSTTKRREEERVELRSM